MSEDRISRSREIHPARERILALLTYDGHSRPLEWCCLGIYALVVSVTISRHEKWFDEAQAWLLARDQSFWRLMGRSLRYEGSPGLWHALLFLGQRLGAGYVWVSVLGGVAGLLGAFLLLRYSPFPLVIRCLLPFTFFLAFQFAVVARSYNLIPPLLYLCAVLYPFRHKHPVWVGLVWVALSHVSLHAFLIACGLVLYEGWTLLRDRRRPSAGQVWALFLFGMSGLLIVWQLIPPPDLGQAARFHWGWDQFAVVGARFLHGSLVESAFLSELVFAVSVFWLWKRRALGVYGLPALLLFSLLAFRYRNVWHEGIVFALWVFALWVSFHESRFEGVSAASRRRQTAVLAGGMLLVCVVQIVWTAKTVAYDLQEPYSGSRALASYLKTLDLRGARIQIDGYRGVAVLPYFEENIYVNLNAGDPSRSYWVWSKSNRLLNDYDAVWQNDPDLVVLTRWPNVNQKKPRPGYREIARFRGGLYWKYSIYEPDLYIVEAHNGGRFDMGVAAR